MSQPSPSSRFSLSRREEESARLALLAELVLGRSDELLDSLGVRLSQSKRSYSGPCPVHGGDNPHAFTLYREGDYPGKWACYTRGCESHFPRTVFGFVRGVLSQNRYGWEPGRRTATHGDAVAYCCDLLGVSLAGIRVDAEIVARQRFLADVRGWSRPQPAKQGGLTRDVVRQSLQVPAPFFIQAGYDPSVLDRFDVGECRTPGKVFCGRAVVPVYQGGFAVGFTARSMEPACARCGLHHAAPDCPEDEFAHLTHAKWRHSKGFHAGSHLYNWDDAAPACKPLKRILLVEGPGCVWRCVETGCEAVVATFGAKLSDAQQVLLETLGVRDVLVGYDRPSEKERAGDIGFEQVKRLLGRLCRVTRLLPPTHDWGGSPVESVRELLVRAGIA